MPSGSPLKCSPLSRCWQKDFAARIGRLLEHSIAVFMLPDPLSNCLLTRTSERDQKSAMYTFQSLTKGKLEARLNALRLTRKFAGFISAYFLGRAWMKDASADSRPSYSAPNRLIDVVPDGEIRRSLVSFNKLARVAISGWIHQNRKSAILNINSN